MYTEVLASIMWPGGTNQTPKSLFKEAANIFKQLRIEVLDQGDQEMQQNMLKLLTVVGFFIVLPFIALLSYRSGVYERVHVDRKDWIIPASKLFSAPAISGKAGNITGKGTDEPGRKKKSSGWRRHIGRVPNVPRKLLKKGQGPEEEVNPNISRDSICAFEIGQLFTKVSVVNRQVVAVKHVNKDSFELTKAINQEVNQIRRLKHPNVNQLVGACIESGNVNIAWGYCSKGSLRDVLANTNIKLDWMFKLSFISDISKGMLYIHSSPVQSHGRLKSTNVVVDQNWCCKVTDINMEKFCQGQRDSSMDPKKHFYNLLWTAPELLRNEESMNKGSRKGDVYSFGIILHEIITREPPFGVKKGGGAEKIIRKVAARQKPPYRPDVSSILKEINKTDTPNEAILAIMMMSWEELPELRIRFSTICQCLARINQVFGTTANLVDQMLMLMQQYADNLEELVDVRTKQLAEEKDKTDQLLMRMLPNSVANELKLGRPVIPEAYMSVTLFFSDVLGFADIAQASTPIQVVDLLNDLYSVFDTIIDTYDVYKVETIGDNYVVSSGLPSLNGDRHASEIATMSLDLLSNVLTFRGRHIPKQLLQLRIGIHTGPVVAGVVGKKNPRYCLFGDTVNYTSRLESNGKPLHIHVSPECKAFLERLGGFYLVERGFVEMKGKGKILTYFLVGKEGFPISVPGLDPGTLKLVGININDYRPVVGHNQEKIILPVRSSSAPSQSPPPPQPTSPLPGVSSAFSKALGSLGLDSLDVEKTKSAAESMDSKIGLTTPDPTVGKLLDV